MTPKSPLDYLSRRNPNSSLLNLITFINLNNLINILNPSKYVGPNSTPKKSLKILGSFSPILAVLVNQSFDSGDFS